MPTMAKASVAGRPAAVLELTQDEFVRRRALVTSTPGGDALLVVASGGELPEPEVLVEVAASVRPTTPDAWDAFEVEASGGPRPGPRPGAFELERGEAEGIEWLFQAQVDDGSVPSLGGDIDPATGRSTTDGEFVIDTCLKLADGQRACLGAGGSESSSAKARFVVRARGPLDRGASQPSTAAAISSAAMVAWSLDRQASSQAMRWCRSGRAVAAQRRRVGPGRGRDAASASGCGSRSAAGRCRASSGHRPSRVGCGRPRCDLLARHSRWDGHSPGRGPRGLGARPR